MYDEQSPLGLSSLDGEHRRQLDSVSDEELLLMFDESIEETGRGPAEAGSTGPPTAAPKPPARQAVGGDPGQEPAPCPGPSVCPSPPLLFDEPLDEPHHDEPPAEPGGPPVAEVGAANQAVLTLGGSPVVVTVRPEPRVSPFEFDEHLPAFGPPAHGRSVDEALENSQLLEEEMAAHVKASHDGRRALEEMQAWIDASDAPATAGPQPQCGTGLQPGSHAPVGNRCHTEPSGENPRGWRSHRRFAVPRRPAVDTTDASTHGPRTRPSRRAEPIAPATPPFSWRKLLASAAVLAAPGSAALLVWHWIAG